MGGVEDGHGGLGSKGKSSGRTRERFCNEREED